MMDQPATRTVSPHRIFNRQEWAALRADTPMTLTADDLARLQSLNDPISLDEVIEIYLPLSRLLSLYVAAAQELYKETAEKNPKFKKVHDHYMKFLEDQVLWFRVCEGNFDQFMQTGRRAGGAGAAKKG